MSTRLLIVDDHAIVRLAIRTMIKAEPTIQVVGEAEDGNDAVRKIEELHPDIILMDLLLPRSNGVETIAKIKTKYPHVKIIVLTGVEDLAKATGAIKAGADGYLLKDVDKQGLLKDIKAVQRGDVPIHPRIARYMIKNFVKPVNERKNEHLTKREREVLQLLVQGFSNKQVATTLGLEAGTVKIYVSSILNKLNVTTRTEAAVWAVQEGLFPAPERRLS